MFPALPAAASHTQLSEIKSEIQAVRGQLTALVNDDRQVIGLLNQITSRLHEHQAQLAAARAELAKIDLRVRSEERRLRRLQARTRARQAVMDARARALYIAGPSSGLNDLVTGATVGDSINRAGLLEYVASADKQLLEDLAMLHARARETKEVLEEERAKAAEARDEIADRVAVVAELAATQREAHAKLSSRIQAARNEIAALEREQERIEALILARQSTGSVTTGGSSRFGYAWPIRGNITSPYGPRWGGYHTGIDIDCNTGQPIGASKAGTVIASEYAGGYGNMIIIDHGGGYSTLYAHMSSLSVGRGARVSQHQRVGACGSTGNSTGDHLHFEVRINGKHTNPRPYLP